MNLAVALALCFAFVAGAAAGALALVGYFRRELRKPEGYRSFMRGLHAGLAHHGIDICPTCGATLAEFEP